MNRSFRAVLCAFIVVVIGGVFPTSVHTWGPQGHRLVAALATEYLTPSARAAVEKLIGPETLPDVASWADGFRQDNYQTFSWHFVDIPTAATAYDRDRDCPRQPGVEAGAAADRWRDCAVDRILYQEQRLANLSLDRADRAIALKFLVHFVGDLHQPYHALGFEAGGNGVLVSIFGRTECGNDAARPSPCNLHSAWDSALIAHRGLDDAAYLAVLRAVVRNKRWTIDAPGTPAEWAMQSKTAAKAALLPQHGSVDEAYYRAHIGEIEQRLALAGLRLAAVINRSVK
jgi:hypothetical protein